MKKLFTLFFALLSLHGFAQSGEGAATAAPTALPTQPTSTAAASTTAGEADGQEVFRKNNVKINMSSLLFNNYSLSYERSLSRQLTFVAGYSFLPERSVTSIYLFDKALDKSDDNLGIDDETLNELGLATVASHAYTGEIRYYPGKKPGARGFYIALYGRYTNLEGAYTNHYETDGKEYIIPFSGSIKGLGGGLMFGSQFLIAKRVTLDWYILGGHYGRLKVDTSAKTDLSTMTPEEMRSLEEDIESVNDDLNGKADVSATVTDRGVSVKGNAPFAGVRGLGFSLGIAF